MRLLIEPYRNDRAPAGAGEAMFSALHALLGSRGEIALEVHLDRRASGSPLAWFAVRCPPELARQIEAALRRSWPSVALREVRGSGDARLAGVRLVRRSVVWAQELVPPQDGSIEPLLRAMAAAGPPATLVLALRPAARIVELVCGTTDGPQPLLWASPIVLAADRARARAIASALAAGPPRLAIRRGAPAGVRRSPLTLFRPWELARLWGLPSPEFAAVPCVRRAVPVAPAPPGIARSRVGGLLRDEHGGLTIDEALRRQHLAVVGSVEQGKTSLLVASTAADLEREDCAVIVLDPKGDAADAVLSVVPASRTCTLLDMAAPTAGFNPLAVASSPDAIADHVVAALRGLFSEGEVRGSSDRYLRNALIAALACSPSATLWDAARLLEVGEAGRALRARVAERLIELPSYAELASFLAHELPAQLADARAATTAKLDAPANKLARVLNSPAVKRVLLNDSLRIDLDRVIERREVLVVRGALGEVGAGNVAVLMQLLLGMLDAALGRVQDRGAAHTAVALKIDEAPLVINTAFAQTLALKRSAGLETVACWQTDAQWQPELREQLDALFAHRVLFATASATDARAASALLMSEYSDQFRAGDDELARLASPDVRLHLPRHTALASWTTARGRERPFIATTIPLALDRDRIDWHAREQARRGGRELPEPEPPPELAIAVAQSPPRTLQSGVNAPPSPALETTASRLDTAASRLDTAASHLAPTGSRLETAASHLAPAASSLETAASHLELQAMDGARRVRWLPVPAARARRAVDPGDVPVLAFLAGARCATTTQVHRACHAGRSLTTTQRALKRLADAGLVARFQLHREDGGGIPQCVAVTAEALGALGVSGRRAPALGDHELERLRGDVHATGWLLALEEHSGAAVGEVLGPGRATLAPLEGAGPQSLVLAEGERPRDFLATREDGARVPAERFAPLRPHAVVEFAGVTDLLVFWDGSDVLATLERVDHLLAGWWRGLERYRRHGGPPVVVVVCDSLSRSLEVAALADGLLTSALARIGRSPARWERPGRTGVRIAAEGDLHRGDFSAWAVPPLPPALREGALPAPSRVPIVAFGERVSRTGVQPPWR